MLEFKDIISIELPHICGDPIVCISFNLKSDFINLTIPRTRIYNLKNVEVVWKDKGYININCTDRSFVYIYSNFDLLNNVYYYPFISSVFTLDRLQIKTDNTPRLEISIPNEFKSLSFLSYVQGPDKKKHIKEMETWTDKKGTFYYPLLKECCFQFTLRATGRSINYGLIHITLPLIIFLLGFLLKYGGLPTGVTDNSSSILFAILMTFTPIYLGILQDFLAKSFMSLSIGMALYAKSYFISLLYILIFELYNELTIYLVLIELCWVLLFLISVRHYFNRGRFNHFLDLLLYKPTLYLIQRRYKKAWNSQDNNYEKYA